MKSLGSVKPKAELFGFFVELFSAKPKHRKIKPMIHLQQIPVAVHITKNARVHRRFFDVGIGTREFSLEASVQEDNLEAQVKVVYNSAVVVQSNEFKQGNFSLKGTVSTDQNTPDSNYLTIEIEGKFLPHSEAWLGTVVVTLLCTPESQAPVPYRVRVNTTGTAVEDLQENPAGFTEITTGTPFRSPTTRDPLLPSTTTTAFDPGTPPVPTLTSPPPPTADPDPTQPPTTRDPSQTLTTTTAAPTTTKQGSPTTTPAFTTATTQAPLTAPPTTTLTPPVTAQPTVEPLRVSLLAAQWVGAGLLYNDVTESNFDTVLAGTPICTDMESSLGFADPTTVPVSLYPALPLRFSLRGGSGSYRVTWSDLPPGLLPLRFYDADHQLPSGCSDAAPLLKNQQGTVTGLFEDKGMYAGNPEGAINAGNVQVRCLGYNQAPSLAVNLVVDDGFSSVTQPITLYFQSRDPDQSKVLFDLKTTQSISLGDSGSGDWLDVCVPCVLLPYGKTTWIEFEPTQEPDRFHIVNLPTASRTGYIDFHTGRTMPGFDASSCRVTYQYMIKNGYAYSRVYVKHPGVHFNQLTYRIRHVYGTGWMGTYYDNYCPHPIGVVKAYVLDLATMEKHYLDGFLLWYTTGPTLGWMTNQTLFLDPDAASTVHF